MQFIDTHTHLFTEEFDADRKETIERAFAAGVEKLYFPAIDSTYEEAMKKAKALFPDSIFLMAALHPCSVKANYQEELEKVEKFMAENEFVGIGETGLDYHWDKTFIAEQKESLKWHCRQAIKYNKPIILHTRESIDDAIAIITEFKKHGIRGIFHCFSGSLEQAKKIINLGFYLGIGGVLTFKNSGLDNVIHHIDIQHIVLETDSPYLSPVPFRGKRNESARIPIIARKLAEVKQCPLEEIAEITTRNAGLIFGD